MVILVNHFFNNTLNVCPDELRCFNYFSAGIVQYGKEVVFLTHIYLCSHGCREFVYLNILKRRTQKRSNVFAGCFVTLCNCLISHCLTSCYLSFPEARKSLGAVPGSRLSSREHTHVTLDA